METNQKQRLTKNKEDSPSRKKWDIFMKILDWISWIIIAIFIYIWWTQRGAPIGCERITTNLCNACFGEMKIIETTQTLLTNLTLIPPIP